MRKYRTIDTVKVWVILLTSPIWISILLYIFSFFIKMLLGYIELGQRIFNFPNGSFGSGVWMTTPFFILAFILCLGVKILEKIWKINPKND